MKKQSPKRPLSRAGLILPAVLILLLGAFLSPATAFQLDVIGVNKDATTSPVAQYKWVVEEDATYHVVPNDPSTNFATEFHKSYMPVVAQGTQADAFPTLDPAKRYYISVLPLSGYSNSGAAFSGSIGDGTVTVHVNQHPIPTAQITVFVFNDNYPVNGAPDLPEEQGLEGFRLILEDAGGKYGISAGQAMMDAFGNMLGTTYQKDLQGDYILDADGLPIVENMGDMNIFTDENGHATVRNLAPGKYGIIVVPPNAVEDPPGSGNWVNTNWQQTSTIEGKKIIDAWVKANEPPYFQEFGPAGFHVFVGFVNPTYDTEVLTGGSTITGRVTNLHLSRPPATEFYSGEPFAHTTPWIGLNEMSAGLGRCVYAQRGNGDGTFSIPNVPPGNYQLVVWDDYMDLIIAFYGVTVDGTGNCNGGDCNLGDVAVFQWFTRLEHWVFNDLNQNGRWDALEKGIPEQAVNLRWRDGTLYQSAPTDTEGFVPFDEVFPFFSWQVAEVDFARYKATGVTVTVDGGGPINAADPWSFQGVLTPQTQVSDGSDPANVNNDTQFRTETGPVLTEAFQGFLGQTSVMQWGKAAYGPNENGGISGIVYYAVTRAENDPAYAAAEPWEPGIPRVQVNLYQDADNDGVVDNINFTDGIEYADVNNYPYDDFPGPGDTDHNGNSVFDLGDAIDSTYTDSWDDNVPTGCPGADPSDPVTPLNKCYDGMRNWNQVRPGIFDGGYAFAGYDPTYNPDGLAKGIYIVEVIPPPGYEIIKEEDRNVDFGDEYVPSTQLLPPACVGDPHLVPTEFSLFPLPDDAPYRAGTSTPLCNRKQVYLSGGHNAAADFFLFTEAPIAGHIMGFILDDTANEFDPASPQFGEKFAPPWLPVSIHDWTGREIGRTYSDQYGVYNLLVPSTYTANLPMFSGMSPNMLTTCMNSPGTINPDTGAFVPDPYFNNQYSTFCYTFQYMPGSTTYLDTPVVPVAAFAGPDQFPLDMEFPDGTPRIHSVTVPGNGVGGGPYVPDASSGTVGITINSVGTVQVPNPEYDGVGGVNPKTISRDYGFGDNEGTVSIGGVALTGVTWTNAQITGTVDEATVTGQLEITRGDNGLSAITGVTVQVGLPAGAAVQTVSAGQSIQAAIDAPGTNNLILVGPGTYDEMVIMYKPVRLQGWGEGSTVIRAYKIPAEKTVAWRNKLEALIAGGDITLLPGQEIEAGVPNPDLLLQSEEGAGVLVVAKADGDTRFDQTDNQGARVDGFTITGADTGGGVVANGYADFLQISNNRIMGNSGFFGGGVRIGHPQLVVDQDGDLLHQDADNDNVTIHHNHVLGNGGLNGAGGGVSLCTGSDNYMVVSNYISGNFTLGDGGGIGHLGLSENGLIEDNTIIFNECFNQGVTVSGGGIFVGGQAPLAGAPLSPGAGSVQISNNLILGNYAGAGDGAGIRLSRINGADVISGPRHSTGIYNNIITNNVAALAGGGISLQDAVDTHIIHNTIAHNDSTATAAEAFSPGQLNETNPQPAGIVSRAHSNALLAELSGGEAGFSDPVLQDNIIWHNRSFYFQIVTGTPPQYLITLQGYNDLAVLGTPTAEMMNPIACLLTSEAGYDPSNMEGDPDFVLGYENGGRGLTVVPGESTTNLEPTLAFDEGGNFIKVRFGPLTITDDPVPGDGDPGDITDYHLNETSPAISAGINLTGDYPETAVDFDFQVRPNGPTAVDIGADEYYAAP